MAAVDLPEGNPRIRLPFGFAKRHKVLLQAGVAGQWQLLISPDTQPAALLEIRRLLNQPFSISRMSAVEFEAMLEAAYQRDFREAQHIMEDIGKPKTYWKTKTTRRSLN